MEEEIINLAQEEGLDVNTLGKEIKDKYGKRTENKNFTFEVSTEGDGLIFWHWSLKCKRILQNCWLPEADSIYEKVKSKTKPKTFAKANIRCGKRKYDKL